MHEKLFNVQLFVSFENIVANVINFYKTFLRYLI